MSKWLTLKELQPAVGDIVWIYVNRKVCLGSFTQVSAMWTHYTIKLLNEDSYDLLSDYGLFQEVDKNSLVTPNKPSSWDYTPSKEGELVFLLHPDKTVDENIYRVISYEGRNSIVLNSFPVAILNLLNQGFRFAKSKFELNPPEVSE